MTPAETLASDIAQAGMPIGARTRDEFNHAQLLKTIVSDLRKNPASPAMSQAASAGQLRPSDAHQVISMLTTSPLQYQIGRMSPENAMDVWRVANSAERAELQGQIAMKLANSKVIDPEKRTACLQELTK